LHEAIDEPVGFAAGEFEAETIGVMAGQEKTAGALESALTLGVVQGSKLSVGIGDFFESLQELLGVLVLADDVVNGGTQAEEASFLFLGFDGEFGEGAVGADEIAGTHAAGKERAEILAVKERAGVGEVAVEGRVELAKVTIDGVDDGDAHSDGGAEFLHAGLFAAAPAGVSGGIADAGIEGEDADIGGEWDGADVAVGLGGIAEDVGARCSLCPPTHPPTHDRFADHGTQVQACEGVNDGERGEVLNGALGEQGLGGGDALGDGEGRRTLALIAESEGDGGEEGGGTGLAGALGNVAMDEDGSAGGVGTNVRPKGGDAGGPGGLGAGVGEGVIGGKRDFGFADGRSDLGAADAKAGLIVELDGNGGANGEGHLGHGATGRGVKCPENVEAGASGAIGDGRAGAEELKLFGETFERGKCIAARHEDNIRVRAGVWKWGGG
jgi:hypothetical protein